jgi:hypothetical protein
VAEKEKPPDLLTLIDGSCRADVPTSELNRLLLQSCTELNFSYFRTFAPDALGAAFKSVWTFFIFAGSQSSSDVRLSSYRAAGSFLLKVGPYFPTEIQQTFSDASMLTTIDLKSSPIIASVFAFISNKIALPFLPTFLDSTPVYHHFANSDSLFSEHLPGIISTLGRLGLAWFETLLHSFLKLVPASKDQFLVRSIAAIVKHHPIPLMKQILQVVSQSQSIGIYLPLVSFTLSSPDFPVDGLELFDLARQTLQFLSNPSLTNIAQIDSSFQLLSIKATSFSVSIAPIAPDSIRISLSKTGGNSMDAVVDITVARTRTALYQLPLPLDYLCPDFKADSTLVIAAQFGSMAGLALEDAAFAIEVFKILEANYSPKYSDIVSGSIKAIARGFPIFAQQCDRVSVRKLVTQIVFSTPASWFHGLDILKLIEAIPRALYTDLFGPNALAKLVDVLVDNCLAANVPLSNAAEKAIREMVDEPHFAEITMMVARRVDFFDAANMRKLLHCLSSILEAWPSLPFVHLQGFVIQAMEAVKLYRDDLSGLMAIFNFVGRFELTFADVKLLKFVLAKVFGILSAAISFISGQDWYDNLKPSIKARSAQMVEADLRSINIDIVTESNHNYNHYLRSLLAATSFVLALPATLLTRQFVASLALPLMDVFPLESAALVRKGFAKLLDPQRLELVRLGVSRLKSTQDCEVAAIFCELFVMSSPDNRIQMSETRAQLLVFANYAKANPESATESQNARFLAFLHFVSDHKVQDQALEAAVSKHCPAIFQAVFGRFPGAKPANRELFVGARFQFAGVDQRILTQPLGIADPVVKTQLVRGTCDVPAQFLSQSFLYYCANDDVQGLAAVLQYSLTKGISIPIDVSLIPECCLSVFVRFLKRKNAPELPELASKLFSPDSGNEVFLAAVAADSSAYLNSVMRIEKMTKLLLRRFAMAVGTVRSFDSALLQRTLTKLSDTVHTKRKLQYLMAATANALYVLKSIPDSFHSSFGAFLAARRDDLNLCQVCRCLSLSSPTVEKSKRALLVVQFLNACAPVSPEASFAYLALSNTGVKEPIEKNVPKLSERYFARRIPSLFSHGLRLMIGGLDIMSSKRIASMMKHSLERSVRTFLRFAKLPRTSDLSNKLWLRILRTPGLKKFAPAVLAKIDKIIPDPSSAAFRGLSTCVPVVMSLSHSFKLQADPSRKIVAEIPSYIQTPTNVFLTQAYLKLAAGRAQKGGAKFVLGTAASWFENVSARDCYAFGDLVLEWLTLLGHHARFEDLLGFLGQYVLNSEVRFFPVFVATMRFAQSLTEPEKERQLVRIIGDRSNEWQGPVVHKWALKLAAEQKRLALDFAQFDRDCPESQNMIELLNKVVESQPKEVIHGAMSIEMRKASLDLFEPIPVQLLIEPESPPGALRSTEEDDLFEPIMPDIPGFEPGLPSPLSASSEGSSETGDLIVDLTAPAAVIASDNSPDLFLDLVGLPKVEKPKPKAPPPDDDLLVFE